MIVRELIALLGFKVDEHSHEHAEKAIDGLKEGALRLAEVFAEAFLSYEAIKGIYEMVKGTAELGEEIEHTSLMLGIESTALQELRFAASQFSVEQSEMTQGLRHLARSAFEASSGSKEMYMNFQKLGINVNDSHGKLKPIPDLLNEASDAFSKMTDKTARTALAQKIFGRSGAQLIPMLIKGSAAINEQRQEAEALGGVLSEDLIQQSEKYIRTTKRLGFIWQGIKNLVAKELLPSFSATVESMVQWIKLNREWIAQNIHKVFDAVVHIMKAFTWVIKTGVNAWDNYLRSVGPVGRALLVIGGIIAGIALMMALPEVAIAALVILIAAMIDDWQTFLAGGDSLIGHWIGPMDKWIAKTEDMKSAWNLLVSSIADQLDDEGILNTALQDLILTPIDFWTHKVEDFLEWFLKKMIETDLAIARMALRSLPGLPGFVRKYGQAENTVAGEALVSAPKTANALRGLEFNVDTKININASGSDLGRDIGQATAKAIDEVMNRHLRAAAKAFGTSG